MLPLWKKDSLKGGMLKHVQYDWIQGYCYNVKNFKPANTVAATINIPYSNSVLHALHINKLW